MKKSSKFRLKLVRIEQVARDTFSFYFDRKNLDFDFIPGQYLKLRIENENTDERGTSRYFTISSSPTDNDFLTITTRIIKSSFKMALVNLKPGESVSAFGPIGYFDFDSKSKHSNIFLAGGIGITPFHSVMRFLDAKKIKSDITLFASFSTKNEIVFFNELKEIEKRNPSFKVIYSITSELVSGFESGRISKDLIMKHAPSYEKSKFFITGSEDMVNSLYDLVLEMKIPEGNIFKEDFPGY